MTYLGKRRKPAAWLILPFLVSPLFPLANTGGLGGPEDGQFITGIFSEENSQTMALLSSDAGPMTALGKGGPADIDLVIVEDSALQGTTGPIGTIMNLSDVPRNGKNITKYVTRPGDTVAVVAQMFGVSANTIRWQNDIDEEILKAGDVIEILPVSGLQYSVKKDDTVASIAKDYKISEDKIVEINNLIPGNQVAVGTKLILPGAQLKADKETAKKSTSSATGKKGAGSTTARATSGRIMTAAELGSYVWPVAGGIVTQGYGSTSFANTSGYYKGNFHGGVDIGAPTGTKIFAAKSGVVTEAKIGYNGGYGNYITLKHDDGTMSRYGHASKLLVKVGDRVAQGDNIALVGSTGRSTGPHLHFEIRDKNGAQMDHNPFYDKYRNY